MEAGDEALVHVADKFPTMTGWLGVFSTCRGMSWVQQVVICRNAHTGTQPKRGLDCVISEGVAVADRPVGFAAVAFGSPGLRRREVPFPVQQ